jgi:subtilisin family serine protease
MGFTLYADYVPGIVLVRLQRGVVELPYGETEGNIESVTGNNDLKSFLQNAGFRKIEKLFPKFHPADTVTQLRNGETVYVQDLSLVFKISIDQKADIETIVDSLNQYTDVIYAEPDYILGLSSFPNDPRFGEQWALKQDTDCDIDADSAWSIETGNTNIKIGIIDLGIEYEHYDLGNGIGPGYKIRGGWDYCNDDSLPEPYHDQPHGTMVSGIASALTHNGGGISGLTGGCGTDIGCQLYYVQSRACSTYAFTHSSGNTRGCVA